MRENFHHLCVCYLSPTCRVLALISLCGCSYWWQISTNYLPTDVIKGRTRSFSIVIKAVLFRKPRFLLPALCFHFSSSHKNSLLKTYLALKCETKMSRTFTLGFEKEKIMHVFHLKWVIQRASAESNSVYYKVCKPFRTTVTLSYIHLSHQQLHHTFVQSL